MEETHPPSPAFTLDCHCDVPWKFTKYGLRTLDASPFSVDLPRMRKGGMDSFIAALYLSDSWQDDLGDIGSAQAIQQQYTWLRGLPGVTVCRDIASAAAAIQTGRTPIFLGLEGGRLLHNNLDMLDLYAGMGIQYVTITHNRNTDWADSATDYLRVGGLTYLGRRMIQRMCELGVLPDISHTSDATAHAVLDVADGPVIASHSGCRAVKEHVRNISLYLAHRVAESGGFIGVPMIRNFIGDTPEDLAQHIDTLVQAIGWEHVGIGSDLDGATLLRTPTGAEVTAGEWRETIVERLIPRGYSSAVITAILGGNALRVLGRIK